MEPSDYVKRLPIGQPIPMPGDGIAGWETFPFEGELRVRRLEPPRTPVTAAAG